MSEPAAQFVANWDHTVGRYIIEVPCKDSLIMIAAGPNGPEILMLSESTAPEFGSDRTRAVLRAFLALALQRLDAAELSHLTERHTRLFDRSPTDQ